MGYVATRCSLEEAFPAALRLDVLAACQAAAVTEGAGPIVFAFRGERVVIPYRVSIDRALFDRADGLTSVQREIFFCIFSRHYDGHVRERALRQFVRSPNEWVIPFVVQLMGEKVGSFSRANNLQDDITGSVFAGRRFDRPIAKAIGLASTHLLSCKQCHRACGDHSQVVPAMEPKSQSLASAMAQPGLLKVPVT